MFSHFTEAMDTLAQTLQMNALTAVPALWVLMAMLADFITYRIPNLLTVGGLAVALLLQFAGHGWNGVMDGLAGCATGFFIYLILYIAGGMGAGDVKLMAAAGGFLGWPAALLAVLLSTAIGVAVSLLLLALRGGMNAYISRYGVMLKRLFLTGQFSYIAPPPGSVATQRFPYAFAIAMGTWATLWLNGNFSPFMRAFCA
jgi:prepilin peptidase CpaA